MCTQHTVAHCAAPHHAAGRRVRAALGGGPLQPPAGARADLPDHAGQPHHGIRLGQLLHLARRGVSSYIASAS